MVFACTMMKHKVDYALCLFNMTLMLISDTNHLKHLFLLGCENPFCICIRYLIKARKLKEKFILKKKTCSLTITKFIERVSTFFDSSRNREILLCTLWMFRD